VAGVVVDTFGQIDEAAPILVKHAKRCGWDGRRLIQYAREKGWAVDIAACD
jgi:hypothetical protein